jgi:hypothetical protein
MCRHPQVGYFLDHINYEGTPYYPDEMRYVVAMQNITAASLPPACVAAVDPANVHWCFMAPHVQQYVKTPFFILNSRFDSWQMDNILQAPCMVSRDMCTPEEQQAILKYGQDFLAQLQPAILRPEVGAFSASTAQAPLLA